MARIDTLANFLEDVATKIRSKTGSQSTITPANYDTEIEKIKFKTSGNLLFLQGALSSQQFIAGTQVSPTSVNLKNIDTSDMEYMARMFNDCDLLETIIFDNDFDTSKVKNMRNMFYRCSSLTSSNLNSFLSIFDTSNVESMYNMFYNCNALTTLDVSSFDTSSVNDMRFMFADCDLLETITFGNDFTFESVPGIGQNNLQNIFMNTPKLDNNTLNAILHLCTTVSNDYAGTKTLAYLGIKDTFDNYANIPNLSNYQAFLDAGWTIS